jgi:hypothetical protein
MFLLNVDYFSGHSVTSHLKPPLPFCIYCAAFMVSLTLQKRPCYSFALPKSEIPIPKHTKHSQDASNTNKKKDSKT